jgi:hypothetical protein
MKIAIALLVALLTTQVALAEDWPGAIVVDPGIDLMGTEGVAYSADRWATCPKLSPPTVLISPGSREWAWEVNINCSLGHVGGLDRPGALKEGCQARPVAEIRVDNWKRWRLWIRCPDNDLAS